MFDSIPRMHIRSPLMNLGNTTFRRCIAAAIAALVLTLNVSLPVLERADIGHEPVVESEHAPGECPQAHDHTICTQVGSNYAAPLRGTSRQQSQQIFRAAYSSPFAAPTPSVLAEGHASRAPPKV